MLLSRRSLLRGALGGGALLAAGAPGCLPGAAPRTTALVGPDGRVRIPLQRYPELAAVGGAVALELPASDAAPIPPGGILVIHRDSDDNDPFQFVATQAACPHAGCPLDYSPSDALIECPCHGSRFRAAPDPGVVQSCAGDVVHRPALQGLAVFPIVFEPVTGILTIDLLGRTAVCAPPLPPVSDGKVTLALSDFPALASPGGSVVGQPLGFPDKLVVARVDDTTAATVSAICTHMGCTVGYTAATKVLDCPCHNSEFALTGAVLLGPAPRPLKSYPTTFDGRLVVITVA